MKKIILLRHGEVDIKENKNILANQLGRWIIKYDNEYIIYKFSSKKKIKNLFDDADILICSSQKRSIQSVEIFGKTPFEINSVFNEAQLPYASWALLKLPPKIWLIFFRVLWFFGYSQNCESFKETKQRAKKATKRLLQLSKRYKTIVLVGHEL
ncbi:MAG: hypothetical protein DRG11_00360 [Epsilonproteobacteria bacterium]|nr:MAG: hypothetical protein DRG11_00360 [Campylobacterota bacterium]